MNNISWEKFPNLKTSDQLKKYFDVRTEGHKEFFHYTSLKVIDIILDTRTIRISSTDRFNDKKDKEQFGDLKEQKKHYSLCFSTGSNENLSLWYLYSGVNGKGGRISFTYNKLMKMISNGEFYFTQYNYKKGKSVGKLIPLINGKNMQLEFRDVLYSRYPKYGNYVDLKYNTMTNHGNVSIEEFEKYKTDCLGFNKSSIWYCEKESRLLIKLIGDIAESIDENKDYAILWKLKDNQIKHMKIMCAPEIADKCGLNEYTHIKEFACKASRISLSENAGDIKMNICDKCNCKKRVSSK